MSKRNQFNGAPAYLLSFAILLIAVAYISNFVWEQRIELHQTYANYQKNAVYDRELAANDISDRCWGLSDVGFQDCISAELETHYVDQAINRDLQAQQDMAFWAYWLLIVSVGGILISGFGVILLVRSIRLGHEANIQAAKAANSAVTANEIMRQEQRAWITLDRQFECNFQDLDFQGVLCWNYNLVNKGKMPAIAVKTNLKIIKIPDLYGVDTELVAFTESCVSNHIIGGVPIIFPGERTDFVPHSSLQSSSYRITDGKKVHIVDGRCFVLCCITYLTGPGDNSPVGVESRAFAIEEIPDFIGPWGQRMREFSSWRIIR